MNPATAMPNSKDNLPRISKPRTRKHAADTLCSFPQEILDMIMSNLAPTDIKTLRLVARAFHPAANAVLFRDTTVVLPDDVMQVIGMGENAEIARCVRTLTLSGTAMLPSLPPLEEFVSMVGTGRNPLHWSTDEIKASHEDFHDYLRKKSEARKIRLGSVWQTRIYNAGDPHARFCDECRGKSTGTAAEALERDQQTLTRLENALLSMTNLASVNNLLRRPETPLGRRAAFYVPVLFMTCIDEDSGRYTTPMAEQRHLADVNRDLVYFILRFFGWRHSLGGKALETVQVNFNCRGTDGLNVLERIGWRHHAGGAAPSSVGRGEACCFHGDQQYSLFLNSISRATVVDVVVETEADKSATEALFLGGSGQDLLAMTKSASRLSLKLDAAEYVFRPDLGGFHPPVTHPVMTDCLGLERPFPQWDSLRQLVLVNVQVFFGALRDMLASVMPGLSQLELGKVVLNRLQHDQAADWWTVFNLIRDRNVDGRLGHVVLYDLKVNAGYIQMKTNGAAPAFARCIPDDAYDLEYLCQEAHDNDSEKTYFYEYRLRILDFVCRRTTGKEEEEQVPQGWDDWDFLYAQVAAHEFRGDEDVSELVFHEVLICFLKDEPRADVRCKLQGWDWDKIFVEHPALQYY